jgi:hypothetical protein
VESASAYTSRNKQGPDPTGHSKLNLRYNSNLISSTKRNYKSILSRKVVWPN